VSVSLEAFAVLHLPNFCTTIEPSWPALSRSSASFFDGSRHDVDADLLIAAKFQGLQDMRRADQRDAAAGNDAFFDAALVACIASSTRAFFSFISFPSLRQP